MDTRQEGVGEGVNSPGQGTRVRQGGETWSVVTTCPIYLSIYLSIPARHVGESNEYVPRTLTKLCVLDTILN